MFQYVFQEGVVMKPRIVLTRVMTDAVMERASREFDAILPPPGGLDLEATLKALEEHQAEGLFFTSGTKLDAATIARIPSHVKIAGTCSVGFDHIDVEAAKARGLIVTNTPDVLNNATADMAFLLILGACRRAAEYDQIMRKGWGRFYGMHEMLGLDVSGKTLGIVGMGRIGRAVARRARGFDMKVIYHNRTRLDADLEEGAEYYADLREMLSRCDILTLHAPGGAGTAGLMNRETFALLPKGAVFVNTARGSLVDEEALLEALDSGQLFAAGLDVFAKEPTVDPRLAAHSKVFLAPHMGSATVETRTAMGFRVLDNIAAVAAGKPPIDPIWN